MKLEPDRPDHIELAKSELAAERAETPLAADVRRMSRQQDENGEGDKWVDISPSQLAAIQADARATAPRFIVERGPLGSWHVIDMEPIRKLRNHWQTEKDARDEAAILNNNRLSGEALVEALAPHIFKHER